MELPAETDDARKVVRRLVDTHTIKAFREWTNEDRLVSVAVSRLAPRLFGLRYIRDVDSKEIVIATQSKCKHILFDLIYI